MTLPTGLTRFRRATETPFNLVLEAPTVEGATVAFVPDHPKSEIAPPLR